MEIIAVFGSRTHTMQFAKCMKMAGFSAFVVNTPREIMSSCGVSVKFSSRAISVARRCLTTGRLVTFKGFYQKILFGNSTRYVLIKNM